MSQINFDKLEIIDWYDGPKMVADFAAFSLYVWNDYSDNQEYDSAWLCLDLHKSPAAFIDFFKGTKSLRELVKKAEADGGLGFGRLECDLVTLKYGAEYRFEITLPGPDSFLEEATEDYYPEITKTGENTKFGFRQVKYGDTDFYSYDPLINGESIYKASFYGQDWNSFTDSLEPILKNLENEGYGDFYYSIPENRFYAIPAPDAIEPDSDIVFIIKDSRVKITGPQLNFGIDLKLLKKWLTDLVNLLEDAVANRPYAYPLKSAPQEINLNEFLASLLVPKIIPQIDAHYFGAIDAASRAITAKSDSGYDTDSHIRAYSAAFGTSKPESQLYAPTLAAPIIWKKATETINVGGDAEWIQKAA